jgi:hypothetical protein
MRTGEVKAERRAPMVPFRTAAPLSLHGHVGAVTLMARRYLMRAVASARLNVTGSRSARPDQATGLPAFGRRVRKRGGRDR